MCIIDGKLLFYEVVWAKLYKFGLVLYLSRCLTPQIRQVNYTSIWGKLLKIAIRRPLGKIQGFSPAVEKSFTRLLFYDIIYVSVWINHR